MSRVAIEISNERHGIRCIDRLCENLLRIQLISYQMQNFFRMNVLEKIYNTHS